MTPIVVGTSSLGCWAGENPLQINRHTHTRGLQEKAGGFRSVEAQIQGFVHSQEVTYQALAPLG